MIWSCTPRTRAISFSCLTDRLLRWIWSELCPRLRLNNPDPSVCISRQPAKISWFVKRTVSSWDVSHVRYMTQWFRQARQGMVQEIDSPRVTLQKVRHTWELPRSKNSGKWNCAQETVGALVSTGQFEGCKPALLITLKSILRNILAFAHVYSFSHCILQFCHEAKPPTQPSQIHSRTHSRPGQSQSEIFTQAERPKHQQCAHLCLVFRHVMLENGLTLTAFSDPASLKSSYFITSAMMKPFSKSVWIFPAAWGAFVPSWRNHEIHFERDGVKHLSR